MTPNVTTNQPDAPANFSARTLGEIACELPGATAVFRRHHLDFCCGGNVALAVAAERRGIDVAALSGELLSLDPGAAPALPDDTDALIERIVARFHEAHRAELPELIRLATKVERVHAEHPRAPQGLAAHLEDMQQELLDHMEKEETVLFPMMRESPGPFIVNPIARMRGEHDDHGRALRRVFELTDEMQLPDGACNTWRALYVGLRKFTDDLTEHIHAENNALFRRFEPQS